MRAWPALGELVAPLRAVAASASMRLAVAVSAIFVAATLLAGAVSFFVLSAQLKTRLQNDSRQMTENLAATYQIAGLPELHAQIATNIATTRDYSNLYLFIDRTGQIVFGNFRVRRPFTGPHELIAGHDLLLPKGSEAENGRVFTAYGLAVPAGWIMTARDARWIPDIQKVLFQSVAWGLALALLLSVALAMVLGRRSERRISRLNRLLDDVARGDLSLRFPRNGDSRDDIGRVAASVNSMLDRLSFSVASLRQVSNDVAHDLRTPLTRLRARLEPLLMREDLPADAAGEVEQAVREVEAIVKTFNAVLRIAQIEGGNARPRQDPVDLGQLVADVQEMLAPVAEDLGDDLVTKREQDGIIVHGDREMLAQALVNLVENAFHHCPAPAHVTITVASDEGGAHLAVCDNGPGIPQAERSRVLRRFYRLEKSRNAEGSGLGLSLVAAITRLHGGELALTDNAPGLCVTLHLPKAG